MKTKRYLRVIVFRLDGSSFSNPLKLSECHLINQILIENKEVFVKIKECTPEEYKSIFG